MGRNGAFAFHSTTDVEVFQAMARCDFLLIPVLSTSNGRLGNRGVNQGYFMVNSW